MKKIIAALIILTFLSTNTYAYDIGESAYVCYKNGTACLVRIVQPGRDESKIEYKESCDINFMNYKSRNETEWVPNYSLMSYSSDCEGEKKDNDSIGLGTILLGGLAALVIAGSMHSESDNTNSLEESTGDVNHNNAKISNREFREQTIYQKYPTLKGLILNTESMDENERQEWLNLIPSMTDEQVDNLFNILDTERKKLDALNNKYSQGPRVINYQDMKKLMDPSSKDLIPQVRPVFLWFKAVKKGDVEQLKTVFSQRMIEYFDRKGKGWTNVLRKYQEVFQKELGDYKLQDMSFKFNGGNEKGQVFVTQSGKKLPGLSVVKENGAWKVDEL